MKLKLFILILVLSTNGLFADDLTILLEELHYTTNYIKAIETLNKYEPKELVKFIISENLEMEFFAIGTIGLNAPGLDSDDLDFINNKDIAIRTLFPFGCIISSDKEDEYRTIRNMWVEEYNKLLIQYLYEEEL